MNREQLLAHTLKVKTNVHKQQAFLRTQYDNEVLSADKAKQELAIKRYKDGLAETDRKMEALCNMIDAELKLPAGEAAKRNTRAVNGGLKLQQWAEALIDGF